MKKNGFTLIELLVVIGIIAVMVGLSTANFLNARQRARDSRRKAELSQMRNALRLYYNDYNNYPADSGGPVYNAIQGCGALGTASCPCSSSIDFAAGGSGCDTIYMKNLPDEFGTSIFYRQVASGDDFCIDVTLENLGDQDIAKSQTRCAANCSTICTGSEYCMCAD